MRLFGEKCVRCSTRTRQVYENRPTCPRCVAHLELALASAQESRRSCPVDGSVLVKEVDRGVILDRCAECGGVWLDAGELDRVNQESVEAVLKSVYTVPLR